PGPGDEFVLRHLQETLPNERVNDPDHLVVVPPDELTTPGPAAPFAALAFAVHGDQEVHLVLVLLLLPRLLLRVLPTPDFLASRPDGYVPPARVQPDERTLWRVGDHAFLNIHGLQATTGHTAARTHPEAVRAGPVLVRLATTLQHPLPREFG